MYSRPAHAPQAWRAAVEKPLGKAATGHVHGRKLHTPEPVRLRRAHSGIAQQAEQRTVECDSCTDAHAQAYLYAEMPSGNTLSYCGNHGTRYLDGLIQQGAKVIDLRHLIEP